MIISDYEVLGLVYDFKVSKKTDNSQVFMVVNELRLKDKDDRHSREMAVIVLTFAGGLLGSNLPISVDVILYQGEQPKSI